MTAGEPPPGTHEIPKRVTSHDAGVQLGREYAQSKLGLRETNWVNPFEDFGKFGQGFDDVMQDAAGNIWIVEYKGGSAGLAPGQMSREWVQGNINRLLDEAPWNPWAKKLQEALDSGKLKGLAISSTDGPADVTAELQRWSY